MNLNPLHSVTLAGGRRHKQLRSARRDKGDKLQKSKIYVKKYKSKQRTHPQITVLYVQFIQIR